MGSDFNEILFTSDRKGILRTNCKTKSFHDWDSEFSLIDLPLLNIPYTWPNFRIKAIDSVFVTMD